VGGFGHVGSGTRIAETQVAVPAGGVKINARCRRHAGLLQFGNPTMRRYRIAVIPGDGIGKEVIPAGRQLLEALVASGSGFAFEFENFAWGGDWFRAHGTMMPDDGLDALRDKDAILFGSAGDPHIPDHVTLWGLRLKICQGFDQYANVRPTRILPGIDAPLKRCGHWQVEERSCYWPSV